MVVGLRYRAPRLAACVLLTLGPVGQAAAQAGVDQTFATLAVPNTAPTQGMWSALKGWPLVGLHASVMPSGQVLTYGTPLATGVQDGRTFDLWDPVKGLDDPSSHYTLPNAQAIDSFCSAGTLMTTGSMLISGGNTPASGDSPQASTVFNPASATPVALAAQLAYPRWYATMISLADSRTLIVGGGKPYVTNSFNDVGGALSRGDVSMTPEIFDPATNRWQALNGAKSQDAFGPDYNRWWYPRMWVAPGGKVFGVSAEKMWSLDPKAGTIATLGSFKTGYSETSKPNIGPTSTAAMFDVGRILQVGGNGPANGTATTSSAAATVFNINGTSPVVTETSAMAYPRQWANSVVLPTGQVVVTGGTTFADNAGANAVYPAEIWTPGTGRWTTGASAAAYRGYHSATILLPSGAILSTGGGVPGPVTNLNAEIYYPPYLFTAVNGTAQLAARPTVAAVSGQSFGYGAQMSLTLSGGDQIGKVSIVGLSSTTHSFNTGQRLIPAAFSQSRQTVTVGMPTGADIAPPGYYMVFLVNTAGVPSRGQIVSIGTNTAAPAASPAGAGQLWVKVGVTAKRVAHGGDGTTALVSTNGTIWLYAGDNAWSQLAAPATMIDVAVVNRSSIYAVDTNGQVYRFNGTAWTRVGTRATTIGAAADGTVVVVSTDQTIWMKQADNDAEAWAQAPGKARRVSPMSAKSYWAIGTDNNVYHLNATSSWTQVGVNASDITTSRDGFVLVSNAQNNSLWLKTGDDNVQNWTYVPNYAGSAVAVAPGGRVVIVGTDGNVYRK